MTHSYTDTNGSQVELKPITAATMRRAKEAGLHWFTDLQTINLLMTDVTALADAVALVSGRELASIEAGLAGDAIEQAQAAIMEAIADFYPSRIGQAIRLEIKNAREQMAAAIQTAIEQSSRPKESSAGTT